MKKGNLENLELFRSDSEWGQLCPFYVSSFLTTMSRITRAQPVISFVPNDDIAKSQ